MNYRILLVEDNPGDALLIRTFLSNIGSLTVANTLAQALEMARHERFDVALVDAGLPDAQGNTAVDKLAKLGMFSVILMTGRDDRELGQAAAYSGAQGYLVKGQFTAAQLERAIFSAIHQAEALRQYKVLLLEGPDGVLLLSEDGKVLFANAAATQAFEKSADELIGLQLKIALDGPAIQEISLENHRVMEIHKAPVLQFGEHAYLIMLRDVTDRLRLMSELALAKQKLEELSVTDPLTGVLNRRGMETELMQSVRASSRTNGRVAAILIDCDNFKSINERFGYRVGDATLQLVTQTVQSTLRSGDHLSRIGGDEFLVILPDATVAEAFYVANKIRDAMMSKCLPIAQSEQKEAVTVSLGVAAIPTNISALNEAVALAEAALIMSKRGGKNQANVVGEELGMEIKEQRDVRQCVMRGEEIRVFSQAIIDAGNMVVGYELLMRGPSQSRFEMPSDFFASARHCNILGVADLVCLRRCLEASLCLPPCARVHINLFPMTALETPFDELLKILALPRPYQLVIELNEQEFSGNARLLKSVVWSLKSAGVLIALDNVGFGSSSLETLLLLEPDIVKIDRSMIDGVADNEGKHRVLERLVACLTSLNMDIIAEGVEREEDAKLVMSLGIAYAQGYLWGCPALLSHHPEN